MILPKKISLAILIINLTPLATQGQYAAADSLQKRIQTIREMTCGPEHLDVLQALDNRTRLLKMQVSVWLWSARGRECTVMR